MKKNSLFRDLKNYFKNTPKEILDKELDKILSENSIDPKEPDMLDILPTREQVKQYRKQIKKYNKSNNNK